MCAGGLYKKYGINDIIRRDATRLTSTDAIKILIDWQENGEKVERKYNPDSVLTTRDVITDLGILLMCNGRRGVEGGRLLAAVSLCLNSEEPFCMRALPLSCGDSSFRFARKEIIYLEDKYDKDINEDITANRVFIESLLALYGYDFVYIPAVVGFLNEKAESGLLEPVIELVAPFSSKYEDWTRRIVRDIKNITTQDFTRIFCNLVGLEEYLSPCLLIKIKTSLIESYAAGGEPMRAKYADFIALPIAGCVSDTVRRWTDKMLRPIGVIPDGSQKLYCKGIHKTLIDYAIHRSNIGAAEKIVIKLQGKGRHIEFVGAHCGLLKGKPTEVVLYLLIIIYSVSGDGVSKRGDSGDCDRVCNTYSRLYEIATECDRYVDLYKSLPVTSSNLKRKIKALGGVDRYNIVDCGKSIRVSVNPDIVYIRDSINGAESQLDEWLRQKEIKY